MMKSLESQVKPMEKMDGVPLETIVDDKDKCKALFKRKVNIFGSKYPDIYELKGPILQCYYCLSYIPYGNAHFCQNQAVFKGVQG